MYIRLLSHFAFRVIYSTWLNCSSWSLRPIICHERISHVRDLIVLMPWDHPRLLSGPLYVKWYFFSHVRTLVHTIIPSHRWCCFCYRRLFSNGNMRILLFLTIFEKISLHYRLFSPSVFCALACQLLKLGLISTILLTNWALLQVKNT